MRSVLTGIGWSTARDILARRGMLGQRPAVDENTILRAYDHTGNMTAVGILRGIDPRTVAGILRRHGVPHGEHGPAPQYGSTIRVPAAAQARRRREPSPADLLWPAEAAAAAGVTAAALLDASRSGRLPNHGTEHFPRYRRDQLAELGAGRTISAMQPSKERNDSQR